MLQPYFILPQVNSLQVFAGFKADTSMSLHSATDGLHDQGNFHNKGVLALAHAAYAASRQASSSAAGSKRPLPPPS